MRTVRWWFVGVIWLAAAAAARADEEKVLQGRVLDAGGKPVAGVDVAPYWQAADEALTPFRGVKTDAAGRFTFAFDPRFVGSALLAYDQDRTHGGLLVVDLKKLPAAPEIKLRPVVRVHGSFVCKELDRKPTWTNVYMNAQPGRHRVRGCSSTQAAFSFRVPPGAYQFWGYGTDIQDHRNDLTLAADKPDVDLGALDVPATPIARHVGKAPPAWTVTDARGVAKDVKVSDFKGKWVLVEFWGFW
jgi:hypothetical protein